MTLLAAAAVAVSVVLVAAAALVLVRSELRDQIDSSLLERAGAARGLIGGAPLGRPAGPGPPPLPPSGAGAGDGRLELPERIGGPEIAAQLVDSDGTVLLSRGLDGRELPTAPASEVIAGGGSAFSDAELDGESLRVLSVAVGDDRALQLARSLEEVESTLSQLTVIIALIAAVGIAAAAGLGLVVARGALAPVVRLSSAAEEVARTEDLTRRIEIEGDDELAQLGESFNTMLAALERSVGAQRQLVADASHELRTPLTSLRTNIETLARQPRMPESERERLLTDLEGELIELGRLVDDIVDLARDGAEVEPAEPVEMRLDQVVSACVERARARAGEAEIVTALEPALLVGRPERIDRAAGNLLDNALKWTPPGGRIEVRLEDGTLSVADSGPGIEAADRERVFDRFYRSADARSMTGSGLGLAIVRQVAEAHGGSVEAGESELGGALIELRLPAEEPPSQEA